MDLSKIEYFLKAAEQENFTKASKQCNIAQTTMSKYIQSLEEEIGCPLFVREKKKVRLTQQGRQFYEGIGRIQKDYERLLLQLQPAQKSELLLGIAMQDYLEIPLFKEFEAAYPDIRLRLMFLSDKALDVELAREQADAFILPDALKIPKNYEHCSILRMEQALICSEEIFEKDISVSEIISGMPMITKSDSVAYHNHCQEKFRQWYQVDCPEFMVCRSLTEQLFLVGMSKGFALLPYSQNALFHGLRAMPLKGDFLETTQLVYEKKTESEALNKLTAFIHEKMC